MPLAISTTENPQTEENSSDANATFMISGIVYDDTNSNMQQDKDELGMPGWNISLFKINGTEEESSLTSKDGSYVFTDLLPGSYVVYANIPQPFLITHPLNNTYTIDLQADDREQTFERNFGVYKNLYRLIDGVSFNADIHGFTVEGLAFDNNGSLYHVDVLNRVINKFDRNGTLLMSLGKDVVRSPGGIVIDSSGNIFISDKAEGIMKFDSNGEFIESLDNIGNGSNQYDSPRGIAMDPTNNLYVADGTGHRIQVFDDNGTYLKTIGNVISPENTSDLPNYNKMDPSLPWSYLHLPFDIKLDSQDNVFVADTVNNRIQKFDSEGNFLLNIGRASDQRIGPFEGQFNRPRALAIGADDSVFVADTYYNRIQVFDNNGKFIKAFGSLGSEPGQFSSPSGIAIDKSTGNVYVADSGNGRIQIFDSTGEYLSEFRTKAQAMEPYFSIIHDGYLILSDNAQHKIHKFDLNNGSHLSEFGGVGEDPGKFRGPRGIAVDSNGNFWIADNYNNRIQKFDSDGNSLLTIGKLGNKPGEFRQPRSLAIDNEGSILVADTQNNRIQKFDSNGTFIAAFTTPSMIQPYQIVVDNEGHIYVAEAGSKKIEKLDRNGKSLLVFGGEGTGPGKFREPRGIDVDAQGNIYTSDQSNRIQKFDSSGKFIMEFGQWGNDSGELFNPRGIFVDEAGNIWVNDTQNERIQVFAADGKFIKEITYLP